MNIYSNLARKRKIKKDAAAKRRAEHLASLPKHPVKRFFYRLHPKRVFKYWFSKRGFFMALKILGVLILLGILVAGGVFAYFRKDLDQIRPEEIAKRVQTTVSRYYDRNGKLLWEDRGSNNYKSVVKSDEISDYMKQATISIEDRDFYNHHGISIAGISRAFIHNASSDTVQGGSTLTQQLVKQIFFADESGKRGLSGIPRKIKEAILAIEVERMYNKDQILTLYLNESPYGGRTNGVESAAQTYFGKHAKSLDLAEASLLAGIPQGPSLYDPYSVTGHDALIQRQHTVLDAMVRSKYISQKEADAAKKVAILDKIKPLSDQYSDIKAPHFIIAVREELRKELGAATLGEGGLTVKTSLDLRIQKKLEKEVSSFFKSGTPEMYGIHNTAATVEDTKSGQIVAMVGSRDFNYPGFGQDNAALAYIQPGSTIKPFVYAKLFEDKGSSKQNYGSGSILRDENIDSLYGAKLRNWDDRFMGDLTIRKGLALSRNIPAVKAMYLSGVEPTINAIRADGAPSYCSQEEAAGIGLSAAIGGCGIKQTELVNAYATMGRMGSYKPQTTILEVKNNDGDTIKEWKDSSKQVMDPQVAYILADILSDPRARASLHGAYPRGLMVDGVKTAGKTGTSDKDSKPKDLWIVNYSPTLTMGLWLGNSDTSTIRTTNSVLGGVVVSNTLEYAYKNVYAKDGQWKSGSWFKKPAGVQERNGELYPSWWKKNQNRTKEKMTFDKVSKKKATKCTPEGAKIELSVTKTVDPVTKKNTFIAPDGYDADEEDTSHSCKDNKPSISFSEYDDDSGVLSISVSRGTFKITSINAVINGKSVGSANGAATSIKVGTGLKSGTKITVTVTDDGYYTNQNTYTVE